MSDIIKSEIPAYALSAKYVQEGAFVDCYYIDIPREVKLELFIKAFYTTSLFKLERTILSIVAFRWTTKWTTNKDAIKLSLGKSDRYSIWTVESRSVNQILLRDFTGKTRSWLMIQSSKTEKTATTRLYFGSVVLPKTLTSKQAMSKQVSTEAALEEPESNKTEVSFGVLFNLLGGFHHLYSQALLKAAYTKLLKNNQK